MEALPARQPVAEQETYLGDLPRSFRSNHPKVEIPFLHMIVHSLKHPVAVLKTNLQILRGLEGEEIKAICLRQVEKLTHLINQILLGSEEPNGLAQPVELNDVVLQALEIVDPGKGAHTFTVNLNLQEIPTINGNPRSLCHAIANLLGNAIDAVPENGMIFIQTKATGILPERHVVLIIHNDGPITVDANIHNIFQPYFTTKQNGNGLGLTIAKQVIEAHHGEIVVTSESGCGTTIQISFSL